LQETALTAVIEMLDAAPRADIVAAVATTPSTSSPIAVGTRSTSPIERARRADGLRFDLHFSARDVAHATSVKREMHASLPLQQRKKRYQHTSQWRFARYCIHTKGVMPSTSRWTPHHGAPRLVDGQTAAR